MAAPVLQMFKNALRVSAEEEEDTRTVDLQVGRTVHTVSGAMRTELWMSVLTRNRGAGHAAAQQYREMLARSRPPVVDDSIEKDVGRTFPRVKRFMAPAGLASLERVLRAYAAFDPDVNYCQGMNFLAALLLVWLPREDAAFGALIVLMHERGLRSLYASDLAVLQARLWQLGKLMPPRLAQHLEAYGALPVLYASSWLLTAFSADFPLFFSARVMDVILSDCYLMPIMKVALGIVHACGDALLGMRDMEAMVDLLRFHVPAWSHERLQTLLTEALAVEWTPKQAAVLSSVSGAESVHDAVMRTSFSQNGSASPEADEQEAEAPPPPPPPVRPHAFSWARRMGESGIGGAPLRVPSPGTPATPPGPPALSPAVMPHRSSCPGRSAQPTLIGRSPGPNPVPNPNPNPNCNLPAFPGSSTGAAAGPASPYLASHALPDPLSAVTSVRSAAGSLLDECTEPPGFRSCPSPSRSRDGSPRLFPVGGPPRRAGQLGSHAVALSSFDSSAPTSPTQTLHPNFTAAAAAAAVPAELLSFSSFVDSDLSGMAGGALRFGKTSTTSCSLDAGLSGLGLGSGSGGGPAAGRGQGLLGAGFPSSALSALGSGLHGRTSSAPLLNGPSDQGRWDAFAVPAPVHSGATRSSPGLPAVPASAFAAQVGSDRPGGAGLRSSPE